ncbi:MAG: hypothetical protein ACPH55_03590 [Luminiphilus sp.]
MKVLLTETRQPDITRTAVERPPSTVAAFGESMDWAEYAMD